MEADLGFVVAGDHPEAPIVIERTDETGPPLVQEFGVAPSSRGAALVRSAVGGFPQCTILAMGSSTMSLAPSSHNAGMRMLISVFGTTVSTA